MINVVGVSSAINILFAINTRVSSSPHSKSSSDRSCFLIKQHKYQILDKLQQALVRKNIYNAYMKYTFSVDDFSCYWFYLQSS